MYSVFSLVRVGETVRINLVMSDLASFNNSQCQKPKNSSYLKFKISMSLLDNFDLHGVVFSHFCCGREYTLRLRFDRVSNRNK